MRKIKLQSLDKLNNITKVESQTVAVNTSVLSVAAWPQHGIYAMHSCMDVRIHIHWGTQCAQNTSGRTSVIYGHSVPAILCRNVVFVTSHIKWKYIFECKYLQNNLEISNVISNKQLM